MSWPWRDDCKCASTMNLKFNSILVLVLVSVPVVASTSCSSANEGSIGAGGSTGAGEAGTTGGSAPAQPATGGIAVKSSTPSGGAPSDGAPSGGAPSGGAPSGGAPSGGTPSGGAPSGGAGGSNAVARTGGTPSAGGQPGGGASGPVFSTSSGGSKVDCSAIGCNVAPRCGESCEALCGCCPCTAGQINGDFVCTKSNCYEPLVDGGTGCAADARISCMEGYMTGSSGVCSQDPVDAVCINGNWSCPVSAIPASACTGQKCPSTLPSGACKSGQSFSCTGWVYSYVSVSCLCSGTWICFM